MLSHIFAFALVAADRRMSITLTVDNSWTMDITGHATISGPKSWTDVKTINKTLKGDGPWVVAVHAVDTGVVAGFFSAVSIDGQKFAVTGYDDPKWTVSLKAENGWKNVMFDDSHWTHGLLPAEDCLIQSDGWQDADADFNDKLKNNVAKATILGIWLPNCKNINTSNFYRLLIPRRLGAPS
jgi:hypothetical protein